MEDTKLNKYMTLLDLTKFRYGEEERRNQSIDNKNMYLIGFVGVMITIEIATLIVNGSLAFPFMDLFVCSIIAYSFAMFYFIKSIGYKNFHSVPPMDAVIEYGKDEDCSLEFVIGSFIMSFNEAIVENGKVMDDKVHDGRKGFIFLQLGILLSFISVYFLF